MGIGRLPNIRQPTSFFDVFTVTAVSIAVVAIVLTIWRGTIVRIEMGVFIVLIFLWVVWAVTQILERTAR